MLFRPFVKIYKSLTFYYIFLFLVPIDQQEIKKVNSQVNLDEKTGKVVSSPSSSVDCDNNNINGSDSDKIIIAQKLLKLQTSSSLPDMQATDDQGTKSSSTTTLSSNINNQSIGSSNGGGGKHVVLALDNYNQIDGVNEGDKCDSQGIKKKIKLNIDPTSSSSASSVNLDLNCVGDVIITEISTL